MKWFIILFIIVSSTFSFEYNWQLQNPSPYFEGFLNVKFDGTHFWVLGSNGKIMSSTDRTNWEEYESSVRKRLNSIAWNDSIHLIVGDDKTILISDDGQTWNQVDTATTYTFNDVLWIDSLFVGVGNGYVCTSADGIIWDEKYSDWSMYNAIIWTGKKVIVAGGLGVLISEDLETWTVFQDSTSSVQLSICCNDSLIVMVGYRGTIQTSKDGESWTLQDSLIDRTLESAFWTGNKFYVMGDQRVGVITSTDGINWQRDTSINFNVSGGTSNGDEICVVGSPGKIYRSDNGTDWFTDQKILTESTLYDVAWTGKEFIAVGGKARESAEVLSSSDGVNWELNFSESDTMWHLLSVAGNGTNYVATNELGRLLFSTDKTNWTVQDGPGSGDYLSVIWNDSCYIAVGEYGNAYQSVDGQTWVEISEIISSSTLYDIVAGDSAVVIVGKKGKAYYTTDGIDWTSSYTKTTRNIKSVTAGNSLFVAVGDTGTIITSPNGVDWTVQNSGIIVNIESVCWSDSEFVALGGDFVQGRKLITSEDGVTWTEQDFKYNANIKSLASGNGKVVAVGSSGIILSCLRYDKPVILSSINKSVINPSFQIRLNNNYINLKLNNFNSTGYMKIRLINPQGRTLYKGSFLSENRNHKISTKSLTKGICFLDVQSHGTHLRQRILIK